MSNTILITGASSGIGKATAKKFQKEGWNVIATMRSPEKETELTELDNVLVTRLDVLDTNSIESAIKEGIEKYGQIDALLNNAGYAVAGTFESAPKENVRRQFDVNVLGLFDTTQAILPHFREKKNGTIINISSIGGKITFPLMSLYHSTKFAVEGFSESLHYELKPLGVNVKIVEPGAIATDFGSRSMDFQHDENKGEYNGFVQHVMGKFQSMMDPNTMSSPDLVANVIYQSATDNSEQLRYRAGADAEQYLDARSAMNDEQFFSNMSTQLELN